MGIANPVKMTIARIRIAAGANACDNVRETEAIVRKSIDMVKVMKKVISRKKKNAPGVLRRPVMKYSVRLKMMEFPILYGMSVSMLAKASAEG